MANNEINADTALQLSKYLTTKFKEKGINQSELLETLSHFSGFKDWNSFKGQHNNEDDVFLEDHYTRYNKNDENWTKSYYMHIDNGGISFSYNLKEKFLMVESSFFGYSTNQDLFKFTKKELGKLFFSLQKTYESYAQNETPKAISGNGWFINDANITIHNQNQSIQFGLHPFTDQDFKKLHLALIPQSENTVVEVPDAVEENSIEDDSSLYAVVSTIKGGYPHEQDLLKKLGFEVGQKFKVTNVNMGSSSTSIRLEDYSESFNSIFFDFTKANGLPYDIYNDPKYNSYLRNYY